MTNQQKYKCGTKCAKSMVQTGDVIQPSSQHPILLVWKIAGWIDASDSVWASEMHLTWWIIIAWSTKWQHWSQRWPSASWRSHVLLAVWGRLVLALIACEKEVSDDFDRSVTRQQAGKIYSDRTKLTMFPVPPFSLWMSLCLFWGFLLNSVFSWTPTWNNEMRFESHLYCCLYGQPGRPAHICGDEFLDNLETTCKCWRLKFDVNHMSGCVWQIQQPC